MLKKPLEYDFRNLLFVLFACFGFAELFLQRYNEYTWVYLMLFGIGLSVLLFLKKTIVLPDKRVLYFLLFAFVVTALQSLLNDSHLVEGRWILRYMTLFILFISYQFFSEEENLKAIAWPFLIFVFLNSGWSFYQYVFLYQTDAKEAFSVFASRFWNISYYAQAVVLSLPFISYFKSKNTLKSFSIFADTTALLIFIALFASQARTSLISLILFIGLELLKPVGFKRKRLGLLIVFGFFINAGIWHLKTVNGQPNIGSKERSVNYRTNIFNASLEMAKDFPTGVGPDRFKSVLNLYYQKDKPFGWDYTDINNSPHSEFLQVLTEDGWAIAIIYTFSVFALLFVSIKSYCSGGATTLLFPSFFICLIPHITFHFPSNLYFPVLLFALSISQFLKPTYWSTQISNYIKSSVTAIAAVVLSVHCIREFKIVSNQYAVPYCEIFHDSFEVCKNYFLESYAANDLTKANDISRPLIKYQPYFYRTIAMDYSLGIEPRSQILACLYYDLFNGDHKIQESTTDKCPLSESRQKKIELFSEFAEKR